MEKIKYYSDKNITSKNCQYNLIIGERSNGKTYCLLKKSVMNYVKNKKRSVYLRRYDDQLMPKNMGSMFTTFVTNKEVEKITKGKYNTIVYKQRKWFLAFYDDQENEYTLVDNSPFMYALALNVMENIKSGFSDSEVTLIIFDEFMTRDRYLTNEFVILSNMLSTIIRQRDDVVIYMLANTVNKSCPYFLEMGLTGVKTQKQGTIDVYHYGNGDLKVAVEYCSKMSERGKKKSNVYFAFDNPRLEMIKNGGWEIDNYPHPDFRVSTAQLIKRGIYLEFEGDIISLELYHKSDIGVFVVCHQYEKDLLLKDDTIIYSLDFHSDKRYRYKLGSGDRLDKILWSTYDNNMFMYANNTVGEILRNYLKGVKN